MIKFLFAILLILTVYIYANINTASRADITHTVVMIPQHLGQILESATNKIDEVQNDYHTE